MKQTLLSPPYRLRKIRKARKDMLDSEEYFQKSFSRNSCGNYNWVDTGCGNKQVEESEKTDNAEVTSAETVYVPEYISLPESFVKTNYVLQ